MEQLSRAVMHMSQVPTAQAAQKHRVARVKKILDEHLAESHHFRDFMDLPQVGVSQIEYEEDSVCEVVSFTPSHVITDLDVARMHRNNVFVSLEKVLDDAYTGFFALLTERIVSGSITQFCFYRNPSVTLNYRNNKWTVACGATVNVISRPVWEDASPQLIGHEIFDHIDWKEIPRWLNYLVVNPVSLEDFIEQEPMTVHGYEHMPVFGSRRWRDGKIGYAGEIPADREVVKLNCLQFMDKADDDFERHNYFLGAIQHGVAVRPGHEN